MKKSISATLLALLLISGFTVPAVFSAEQAGQPKDKEATEIEWQQALKKETSTRIALLQARAAALKARIALEIEQSPEKAGQALEEAQEYLAEAKASASKRTAEGIAQLELDAQAAKQAVTEGVGEAKDKTNALVVHTEEQLQTYGEQVRESEEAVLLRKRYAELEAQAALLKAQLAASAKATLEQAQSYLDEAKAWYARAQSQAKETARLELQKMNKRIDDTKVALKEGGKQAGKKLSDLLKWAAERVEVKEEK